MKDEFSILGQKVSAPITKDQVETFPNPGVEHVTMECIEFTSTCPITGQPDFGMVTIFYHPREKCLESKSIKLYLWQFRDQGTFCEALSVQICDELFEVLEPKYLRVDVQQSPRGGIGITSSSEKWLPESGLMVEKMTEAMEEV